MTELTAIETLTEMLNTPIKPVANLSIDGSNEIENCAEIFDLDKLPTIESAIYHYRDSLREFIQRDNWHTTPAWNCYVALTLLDSAFSSAKFYDEFSKIYEAKN